MWKEKLKKRKKVVERYRERLEGIKGIQLNHIQDNVKSNYAYFPVIFDEKLFGHSRNEVFDKLAENNIMARKYFYPLTNTFDCYHGQYDVSENTNSIIFVKTCIDIAIICRSFD